MRVTGEEHQQERRTFTKSGAEPLERCGRLAHAEVYESDGGSRAMSGDSAAFQLFPDTLSHSPFPLRACEVTESGERPVTPLRHSHRRLEIDNERATVLNLKEERGVEVARVEDDSPASKGGIKTGVQRRKNPGSEPETSS